MKVTITYFKTTGKFYIDEETEWKDGPFEDIVRLKNMLAVCMDNPLGYPQCYNPIYRDNYR